MAVDDGKAGSFKVITCADRLDVMNKLKPRFRKNFTLFKRDGMDRLSN